MSSIAAFNRVISVLQRYANVPASEVQALARELDDLPGAGGPSTTVEAMAIPVDYNAVGAIDVPSGAVFATQDDVTRALAGATSFKYLQQVYDALPATISHIVTINMAAGVHRPHPTNPTGTTAWVLNTKVVGQGGQLNIVGAAPSLWTPKAFTPSALAITAVQAANRDPFVDLSGTPLAVPAWAQSTSYAVGDRVTANGNTYIVRTAGTSAGSGTGPSGDGSNKLDGTVRWDFVTVGSAWLKGWWAVFNTGQAAIVHDHTSSRVNCIEVISPAPSSILYFARPSTVLRNSLNDTTSRGTAGAVASGTLNLTGIGTQLSLQDISLEPFTANANMWSHTSGTFRATRFLMDAETAYYMLPATTFPAQGNQLSLLAGTRGGSASLFSFVFADRVQDNSGADVILSVDSPISIFGAFMQNSEDGVGVRSPRGIFGSVYGLILDRVGFNNGNNPYGAILADGYGVSLAFFDPGTAGVLGVGRENELRGGHPSLPGITYMRGATNRTDAQRCKFKNHTGPVVRVVSGSVFDIIDSDGVSEGFLDAGGNADVGIDVVGPTAGVGIRTNTTITGTNGDVRIGGSVVTYASIPSTGTGHANSASAIRRV